MIYVLVLAGTIREGWDGATAWRVALDWHQRYGQEPSVRTSLERAGKGPPTGSGGFVLNALQNAFYQATHAATLAAGIEATVMQGGDADTNACVAGAFLGAIHGLTAIPFPWRDTLTRCQPDGDSPQPRPPVYWPRRVPGLARSLVRAGDALAATLNA